MTTRAHTNELLLDLETAYEEARGWGFDLPSKEAMALARHVLERISHSADARSRVEIGLGEDGSIELSRVDGTEMTIVNIPPSGSRIEMALQNWKSGEILASTATVTSDEVIERLERAA